MTNLKYQILDLLRKIGCGRMPSVCYDTAWGALLGDIDNSISDRAINWLSEHQLPDGSWGACQVEYYHDRVISTLAALIALNIRGRRMQDRIQVDRGLQALNRILAGAPNGLAAAPNGATVGFEMIVPSLINEAKSLGIIQNQGSQLLRYVDEQRTTKLRKLRYPIDRNVTLAFSAELAWKEEEILDISNLPEANGSVGFSPSATAYYASQVVPGDLAALGYLRRIANQDGGLPNVAPFDLFEVSWTLWNLALTTPSIINDPNTQLHVKFLQDTWTPNEGSSFGAGYSVKDGDVTSIVADCILQYTNQAMDLNTILSYERENHFICYKIENNPSTSTNVHILMALKRYGLDVNHPSIKKVFRYLHSCRNDRGYWADKWHISPFYTTSHVIIACSGFAPEVALESVAWIHQSQNVDGSWGIVNGRPTAEETAYCIQSLWVWEHTTSKRNDRTNLRKSILRGINWLIDHMEPPYPPLWIGKVLYCPENVVRSAVLSALAAVD